MGREGDIGGGGRGEGVISLWGTGRRGGEGMWGSGGVGEGEGAKVWKLKVEDTRVRYVGVKVKGGVLKRAGGNRDRYIYQQ